jgi:hypothetical protein
MGDETPTTTTTATAPAPTTAPTVSVQTQAPAPMDPLATLAARLDAAEKAAAESNRLLGELRTLRQRDSLRAAVPDILDPVILDHPLFEAARQTDAMGNLTPAANEALKKLRTDYPSFFRAGGNGGLPNTAPTQTAPLEMSKTEWKELYRTDPKRALTREVQDAVERWVRNHG